MIYSFLYNPVPNINALFTSVNTIENADPYFVGFIFGLLCTTIVIALIPLFFWISDKFK